MEKLIITAAINGGITTKRKNPNLPYTPPEIAEEAYRCWNAGAAVVHVHARGTDGSTVYDDATYFEIISRIREKCDVLINFSTSTLNMPNGLDESAAWGHLKYKPDLASLNCGSLNHSGKPFINSPPFISSLANEMKNFGVKPELEIYHNGMFDQAFELAATGCLMQPSLYCLVLGVKGGCAASPEDLQYMIGKIPSGAIWSALALGSSQLPINSQTILLGGHVRTGFEDNVYYSRGRLADSNAQLVERVIRTSTEMERPIACPADARKILGITEVFQDFLVASGDNAIHFTPPDVEQVTADAPQS